MERIEQQSRRLTKLTDQLLNVSRAERKPQVPPHAGDDDHRLELTFAEQWRPATLHATTDQTVSSSWKGSGSTLLVS